MRGLAAVLYILKPLRTKQTWKPRCSEYSGIRVLCSHLTPYSQLSNWLNFRELVNHSHSLWKSSVWIILLWFSTCAYECVCMFKRSDKGGMLTSFLPDLVGYVSRHRPVKKLPVDVWKGEKEDVRFWRWNLGVLIWFWSDKWHASCQHVHVPKALPSWLAGLCCLDWLLLELLFFFRSSASL